MDDGDDASFVRVLFIVIFMPSELCFTIYSLLFFSDVIDIGRLDTFIADEVGLLLFVLALQALPPPADADVVLCLSLLIGVLVIDAKSAELVPVPIVNGAVATVGVFGGDSSLT